MKDSRIDLLSLGAALAFLSSAIIDYLTAILVLSVIVMVFLAFICFSNPDESDPFFNW